ncbi:unnamed protein product [Aureobasidium uvarum]|uniref:Uncharacterized protein n=1 Tax=Aureobasidium uvarum TaxID=2773716 RepID=A0A9N8PU23_9PEZI|nr:unnamed protein product [Aureobasidium uvarum]
MPDDNQPMCYRHGRKLKLRKSIPAGMDKAFSGVYVPTGPMIRQQVDPLSPWAVGRCLAKTSGTTVSPDICPDCLAEQRIMEREIETNIQTSQARSGRPFVSASSSISTEPGTPPASDQPLNVLVGTSIDNQTVNIPGATVSDLPPDKFGGIVATDLGEMIDAIIVEHSGSLGKVISNIRNGMPDSDWTQKLSRDLAKKRAKTMPELLDLVDAATEEFGMTSANNRKQDFNLDRPLMPGDFPHTSNNLPAATVNPPAALPLTPSSLPAQSIVSEPSYTAPQAPRPTLRSEQSVAASQAFQAPITYSATSIEPLASDADEDEATLVETETPVRVANIPVKGSQDQSAPREASTNQQRSRIPKATTIPLTKHLYASSDRLRSDQTRPKPSMVAKQHQQQRTFQQGWLREAAVVERAERRSRSRSRGANHV